MLFRRLRRIFSCGSLLLGLALAISALSACTSLPSQHAPMNLQSPDLGYRLEPGNRIRISVFNQANLSGDYTLDPGGNISMPLAGTVMASGLTSSELATRIGDILVAGSFLQTPKVSVEVQTFRPFYVLGEVRQPGEFPYVSGMTVLSAIAKAGGYDYRAREGEVILIRMMGQEQVDYTANERTPILPGDIIRVLQRHF